MNGMCVGGAPVEQSQREAKVGLDHGVAVARGGLGNRAEMNDAIELAAIEPADEIMRRHEIGKRRFCRLRHLPSLPSVSQTAKSVRPASLRLATTFDPMNPAPPVTNNILVISWTLRRHLCASSARTDATRSAIAGLDPTGHYLQQ